MSRALYEENYDRILKTIRFEKTDRCPVAPSGQGFCTQVLGISMAEYCSAMAGTADMHIKSWSSLKPLIDAVHCVNFHPDRLTLLWLSKVKVAGRDLPDNEMWQVVEEELMTVDDYDQIISGGFLKWRETFMKERLNDPMSRLAPMAADTQPAMEKHKDAGIVPLVSAALTIPFENICGARGMVSFMQDLIRRPEKVKEALAVAGPELLEANRQVLRKIKPIGVWVGGWRSASELLSPKVWESMVWPYFKQLAEMVIEEGVIPVYHLDSNWIRDLERFKELPKHKGILALDGATDIIKARKIMGDHTALLGDVPATMLAFDEPAAVKAYVKKLIKEFDATGYLVGPACDTPTNAKPANMEAMIQAAHEV